MKYRWFLTQYEYESIKNKNDDWCGTIIGGWGIKCCKIHKRFFYIIVMIEVFLIIIYLIMKYAM